MRNRLLPLSDESHAGDGAIVVRYATKNAFEFLLGRRRPCENRGGNIFGETFPARFGARGSGQTDVFRHTVGEVSFTWAGWTKPIADPLAALGATKFNQLLNAE